MDKLKWIFIIVIIVIILNLTILYALFFKFRAEIQETLKTNNVVPQTEIVASDLQLSPTSAPASLACPISCLKEITNIKRVVSRITPSAKREVKETETKVSTETSIKEYSIFLGSGSTKSDSWEDIDGLNAYIDSNNYKDIKSVVFEASLRIPTANGTVYARVYNKTDGQAIWSSEISTTSDKSTFLRSGNINLGNGNKLYQVQMKTTMKFESLIDSARLKIVLK
jgi:hypothetical protein